MKYTECQKCNKMISNSNIKKHQQSCGQNDKIVQVDENWKTLDGKFICPLCYEKFSKNGISTHIKVTHFGMNHMSTGHKGWNKGLTKETDDRVKRGGETFSKNYAAGLIPLHGCCAPEWQGTPEQISASSKGGGYKERAGRSKGGYVIDSFGTKTWLQSSYETKCANVLDELGVSWIRPKFLNYTIEGEEKERKYYPDFLLVESGIYLDPKNDYLQKIDKPKIDSVIEQNKVQVIMLSENEINKNYLACLIG